jgi:hypothetical protein
MTIIMEAGAPRESSRVREFERSQGRKRCGEQKPMRERGSERGRQVDR